MIAVAAAAPDVDLEDVLAGFLFSLPLKRKGT